MQPMFSQSSSSIAPDENIEYPILVLTQQPDSHHFNERRIVLNDTIKVGRSVARARPCESNAIFDCKVLSRNHAIFWFDNGKVLLKDTKSSNGTFVNSQLLSKGTEDSAPREIYSGDIIQFGVEVVENTTTHGCIIAQTTIYLSDGNELRRHSDMGGVPSGNVPISNYYEEQIYQLAQYIQEASHREQTLEKKLNSLSQLIIDTQEASDSSWKVILNQDRLMEKLELLQEQVDMHAKGDDQDGLTVELQRVLEQRYGMERESKRMLESLMEEKSDVLQRVVDLEQSLGASEEECTQLRVAMELLQSEHGQISERLSSGKDEVDGLQRRLTDAQNEYNGEISRMCQEKESLLVRYNQLCVEADDLRSRLYEAESELSQGRAREDQEGDNNEEDCRRTEILRALLHQFTERQALLDTNIAGLETQLSRALLSEILALENLSQLNESVTDSETSLDSCIASTTSGLGLHLMESHRQIRDGIELIGVLRDELARLQQILRRDRSDMQVLDTVQSSEANDGEESGIVVGESLHEMDGLLDKMYERQVRARTLVAQIPEKLLVYAAENVMTANTNLSTVQPPPLPVTDTVNMTRSDTESTAQTDLVTMVHSAIQYCTDTDSMATQVDLPHQSHTDTEQCLQQCLESLKTERCLTESLQMDLLQLQDDKRQIERRSNELSLKVDELQQEAMIVKQDMDTRRDSIQRIASEGYSHLYQESQELRKRVQEIEEEMAQKREEYDVLYEQYETLIASQQLAKSSVSVIAEGTMATENTQVDDNNCMKIRELEELCSRQQLEIEEMRESMTSNYQTLVARARKISALSVVPLCLLVFGIIVCLVSLLSRPWLQSLGTAVRAGNN